MSEEAQKKKILSKDQREIMAMLQEIAELKRENRKLKKEVERTRGELLSFLASAIEAKEEMAKDLNALLIKLKR